MTQDQPLYLRLYTDEALYEAARIIGYAGITPFAFWDAAKPLWERIGKQRVQTAVYDLTRADRREQAIPAMS